MRGAAFGIAALLPLLCSAIVVPFDNAELGLARRAHNTCPRTVGRYQWCDAVSKCCQPGYGCNTCGEGNVGQSCVKREKDGCKKDSDCYHSQKCIDNGKEPSFCAQLWVDDLPKPGEKDKKKKKKPSPTQHLNPSSLAPSSMIMAPSSMIMAPSSMVMAPSSMLMGPPMPTPKKQIPAVTPKAQPPKQAPKAAPKAEAPKAEQSPKQASHEPKKEPKEPAPKPTHSA